MSNLDTEMKIYTACGINPNHSAVPVPLMAERIATKCAGEIQRLQGELAEAKQRVDMLNTSLRIAASEYITDALEIDAEEDTAEFESQQAGIMADWLQAVGLEPPTDKPLPRYKGQWVDQSGNPVDTPPEPPTEEQKG